MRRKRRNQCGITSQEENEEEGLEEEGFWTTCRVGRVGKI